MSADTITDPDMAAYAGELIGIIETGLANRPRSQQTRIGPSSAGHPCDRRVLTEILGVERPSQQSQWLAGIGVWAHDGIAECFRLANEPEIPERWVIEEPVRVSPSLAGTGDLYDAERKRVVDWKIVGEEKIKAADQGGFAALPVYQSQVHFYGLGHENAGREVLDVMVLLLPRNHPEPHKKAVPLIEPYDRARAERGLLRLDLLRATAFDLDLDEHPENIAHVPIKPHDCQHCPWFSRKPLGPWQCDGGKAKTTRVV